MDKIADELEDFYAIENDFSFQIKYSDSLTYKDFLNRITFTIAEGDKIFNISDCGTGIQSLTIIALHRHLASLQHSNVVIGVEEPETNLHPQSQKELMHGLKESSQNGTEAQIIFTTHSPVIIDQIDHNQVVLFRKVPDPSRSFKSVVSAIEKDFWEKYEIDNFQYYQFHRYRNSDFFYSKLVIIVESKNDAQIVELLLSQKGMNIDQYGVSMLNLEGIDNIKYPLYLLKDLGIPTFIILDKDYFLPYLNYELEESRNTNGFPKYRYEYKEDCLIRDLVPNAEDRKKLLELFRTNHSQALDLLQKYNIVCFNYSLEIDLIGSSVAREQYHNRFGIASEERTTHKLLIGCKKGLKNLKHLIHVVERTPHKSLPHSYIRIKNVLPDLIKEGAK